jgi:hypothetical protein
MTPDDKLRAKAGEEAAQWLIHARDEIDALFGANYAKANPGLVSMFMRVAAMNYETTAAAQSAARNLDEFSRLVDQLYNFRTKELPMLLAAPERKK